MAKIKYVGAVIKFVDAGYSTNQIGDCNGEIAGLYVKRMKPFVSYSFYCDKDWNFDEDQINAFLEEWKNG